MGRRPLLRVRRDRRRRRGCRSSSTCRCWPGRTATNARQRCATGTASCRARRPRPGAANTSTFFTHCLGPGLADQRSDHDANPAGTADTVGALHQHRVVGAGQQLAVAGAVAVCPHGGVVEPAGDEPRLEPAHLLGRTAVRTRRARRRSDRPSRNGSAQSTPSTPSRRPSGCRYGLSEADTSTMRCPMRWCHRRRATVSARSQSAATSSANSSPICSTWLTLRPRSTPPTISSLKRSRSRRTAAPNEADGLRGQGRGDAAPAAHPQQERLARSRAPSACRRRRTRPPRRSAADAVIAAPRSSTRSLASSSTPRRDPRR